MELLKLNVGEVIAKQMAENWTPEFCRFYELKRIGRFWHTRGEDDILERKEERTKNVLQEENVEKAILEPLERPKIR